MVAGQADARCPSACGLSPGFRRLHARFPDRCSPSPVRARVDRNALWRLSGSVSTMVQANSSQCIPPRPADSQCSCSTSAMVLPGRRSRPRALAVGLSRGSRGDTSATLDSLVLPPRSARGRSPGLSPIAILARRTAGWSPVPRTAWSHPGSRPGVFGPSGDPESPVTTGIRGRSSVGRASASQAEGRGFETRRPLLRNYLEMATF